VGLKDRMAGVPVLGTALAVQERYKQDAADQLAAAIGFFGFLSLFPLMAVAVAAAGYVYADPADQARVAQMITQAIPGFEATMGEGDTGVAELVENVVANRGAIGVVGLLTLLWAGLRVVNSAMTATTVVLRAAVPTGAKARLRQVVALVVLGVVAFGAVGASSLAGAPEDLLPRSASVALALGVSLVLDVLLFATAYRMLRGSSLVGVRALLPGAVLAAVGWTALKVAGASYVGNQMDDANAMYGAMGSVIALLLLLYLAGRLYLYGAELSAVRLERRYGTLEHTDEVAPGEEASEAPEPVAPPAQPASRGGPPGGASSTAAPVAPGGGEAAEAGGADTATLAAATAAGASDRQVGAAPLATAPAHGTPVDPGPTGTSPAVRSATRDRLAVAEQERPRGADVKGAVGFAVGIAAVAAAWRFLRDE
jgi:YihY family inner membrane protein